MQCTQSSRFHWADELSTATHCVCTLIASSFALLLTSSSPFASPPEFLAIICWVHCFWPSFSLFMYIIFKYQFSSVAQSCLTLCDPMNRSTPGLPVHHQLPEFTETHVHPVSDAIQPSHPLSSPSPLAPNPSQHQSLFQWVNSSHEVAKVLDFQL